jgi:thymidylate synthase
MQTYLDIVRNILEHGQKKPDRTGTGTIAIAGAIFEHDMGKGFPLLTTKKMPFKVIASELEFFIKGITDKQWLRDRNNHIWDEWANPKKAPYGNSEEARRIMAEELDLGAVYGFQWRHFGAEYEGPLADYTGKGIDQLAAIRRKLRENPDDRRMLVTAWNPTQLDQQALPPCHYGFQVTVLDGRLNLLWNQRSVDCGLGLPFNIASYGLLLHLLAKEAELKEGRLIGFLGDVHVYENHLEMIRTQLSRDPLKYPLPTAETDMPNGLDGWTYEDTRIVGYQHYPALRMEIAI